MKYEWTVAWEAMPDGNSRGEYGNVSMFKKWLADGWEIVSLQPNITGNPDNGWVMQCHHGVAVLRRPVSGTEAQDP